MKLFFAILFLCSSAISQEIHEYFIDGQQRELSATHLKTDEIELRLKTMGGFYISGRVKHKTWLDDKGREGAVTLREVVYWNEEAQVFVHAWQGPFYQWTPIITNLVEQIVGEEPRIVGEFYEKTQ